MGFVEAGAGAGGVATAGAAITNTVITESRQWAQYVRTEMIKTNQSDNRIAPTTCSINVPDEKQIGPARGKGWTAHRTGGTQHTHLFSVHTERTSNKMTLRLTWETGYMVLRHPSHGEEDLDGTFVYNVKLDVYGDHLNNKGWSFIATIADATSEIVDDNGQVTLVISAQVTNGNKTRSLPATYTYTLVGDGSLRSRFTATGGRAQDVTADPYDPDSEGMRARVRQSNIGFLHGMAEDVAIPVVVSFSEQYLMVGDGDDKAREFIEAQNDVVTGTVEYDGGQWVVRRISHMGARDLITSEFGQVSKTKKVVFK
jgi:hypothetical protein